MTHYKEYDMKKALKVSYVMTQAIGLLDLGYQEDPRFAVVHLDVDGNGQIDFTERKAVKANLYSLAVQGGGKPLLSSGKVLSVNSCIQMGTDNPAQDDSVILLNKGDEIEVAKTDLSFATLHFLVDNGYLV